MRDSEFLTWMANRLVNVYAEHELTDFVHKLREIAKKLEKLEEQEKKNA